MKTSVQTSTRASDCEEAVVLSRSWGTEMAASSQMGDKPNPGQLFMRKTIRGFRPTPVTRRIAKSMLGRVVTVRVDAERVMEGVVTEVKMNKAKPTVLVSGLEFGLDQILTAAPADIPAT